MTYFIAMLCVFGIAIGQILFKLSASYMHKSGSYFDPRTWIILFIALALDGLTTLAWVWVLQKIDLGRTNPFVARAFILAPIGIQYVFGERFHLQYFIGITIITAGS